jgi:hypothetical protein
MRRDLFRVGEGLLTITDECFSLRSTSVLQRPLTSAISVTKESEGGVPPTLSAALTVSWWDQLVIELTFRGKGGVFELVRGKDLRGRFPR